MPTGNPYRKPRPGDPLRIPASLMGEIIDTTQWVKAQRQRQGDPSIGNDRLPPGRVYVRNDSGGALARFAVVALGAGLLTVGGDQFFNTIVLSADAPAADGAIFAVLLEPLAADAVGQAAVAGVVPVQIAVSDADHTRARATSGTATLASVAAAAAATAEGASVPILFKDSGTGDKWALVLLPAERAGHAGLFAVTVAQDGGSAGSATAACSWTYTATDLDGNQLATGLSPQWHRQDGRLGAYLPGEHGAGYYDDTGTFVLEAVDETPDLDDQDGTKGWTPACVPACYDDDQVEPDHKPAPGSSGPCEDVNLSKCRSTVTVVGSGFSGDQAGFNVTHELTYVNDGDGPHWEKKPITGVTGDGQADNGRIMLFCGTGGSTFGWKIDAGWQKLDLSGSGSFGVAHHYTNRTCPPVAEFDDDSTLSGTLEITE